MIVFSYCILFIYICALSYIGIFCLMQLHLLFIYIRKSNQNRIELPMSEYPMVSIQLPIFNEKYVIERLINAVTKFDYPKDRFEIRVLDDSSDETVDIVHQCVTKYKKQGFNIHHITREARTGFKAGALRDDMKNTKGEFIAIFDADFVPKPDFLKRTMPFFEDANVGVVQTRWGHLNEDYSLLTKLQAFHLNVHFTVEQAGRDKGNYFLQFNGTGGVWRAKAIEEAGGWEADTLTEDLDLCMRAQLNGYKIAFLENIVSPAELPAEMNGLKSQQYRWMKGGAETAKKLIPSIWKSDISFGKKLHTTLHLLGSTVFLCVFLAGFISVPLVFFIDESVIDIRYFSVFLANTLAIVSVYFIGNVKTLWIQDSLIKKLLKFVFLFPLFLAMSMGLSLHNSIAVIQGFIGKKTPFIRTPKLNLNNLSKSIKNKQYITSKLSLATIFEGLLSIYFLSAIIMSIKQNNTPFLAFHSLLLIGYGSIFIMSIKHLKFK